MTLVLWLYTASILRRLQAKVPTSPTMVDAVLSFTNLTRATLGLYGIGVGLFILINVVDWPWPFRIELGLARLADD
jgi:hypothetical protein